LDRSLPEWCVVFEVNVAVDVGGRDDLSVPAGGAVPDSRAGQPPNGWGAAGVRGGALVVWGRLSAGQWDAGPVGDVGLGVVSGRQRSSVAGARQHHRLGEVGTGCWLGEVWRAP
jgi:hypothetical protein